MTPSLATLLEQGNQALEQGAWAQARECFEAANALKETGEAHEGLGWAAWWLNDGDMTFRAREAAYRLYREAGNPTAAARIAMWLGSDHEDFRGELAIARGWRERARRLLEGQALSPEHGWLPVMEGEAALLLEEDTTRAVERAQKAGEIASQGGFVEIGVMALALEGLALVNEGRINDGMRRLDEAAAAVVGGEVKDDGWATRVLCYLIFACERIRDFGRAAQWCEKMREIADRMRFTFAQGICRAHYAGVLISRGKWGDAESQLTQSAAMLEESRPAWVVEAQIRLADLRRRQGRAEEAEELLSRIDWYPFALLGLAEISLDAGRLREAEERVERFLRHVPVESRLQRAHALELMVRTAALAGKTRRAAEALAGLESVVDAAATPTLRAAACYSKAMIAVADGDYELARTCLEDAADLYKQSQTPYETARARLELAGVLVSLGRKGAAREEAARALETLEALGSRHFAARARALVADIDAPNGAGSDCELTPRQVEILRLVSTGLSDREIAAELELSEHTVHRHVANILVRLDTSTRAAAVGWAATRGLI